MFSTVFSYPALTSAFNGWMLRKTRANVSQGPSAGRYCLNTQPSLLGIAGKTVSNICTTFREKIIMQILQINNRVSSFR